MKQQLFICGTCGIEYESADRPPLVCKICADERQYISPRGQGWTVLQETNKGHKNIIEKIAANIYAIYTTIEPFQHQSHVRRVRHVYPDGCR